MQITFVRRKTSLVLFGSTAQKKRGGKGINTHLLFKEQLA